MLLSTPRYSEIIAKKKLSSHYKKRSSKGKHKKPKEDSEKNLQMSHIRIEDSSIVNLRDESSQEQSGD